MAEEDKEETGPNIAVARYPVLPSLVALQQMRYRLGLANLGKKLMKWTATATRKELLKMAGDIEKYHVDYHQRIVDAYINLARCRFYYPSINQFVLSNTQKEAATTVNTTFNTLTGIKCLNFEVVYVKKKDSLVDLEPYEHLGIGRGGECIRETKRIWRELLIRMIMMLQLRTNFDMMDQAYRSANKRHNVLGKMVIPRCIMTIRHIEFNLEELAREDYYRMKLILKIKRRGVTTEKSPECPVCLKIKESSICDPVEKQPCAKVSKKPSSSSQKATPCCAKPCAEQNLETTNIINRIVSYCKNTISQGLQRVDVKEMSNTLEKLKVKLDEFVEYSNKQQDPQRKKLQHFQSHVKELLDITKSKPDLQFTNSDNFKWICNDMENQIKKISEFEDSKASRNPSQKLDKDKSKDSKLAPCTTRSNTSRKTASKVKIDEDISTIQKTKSSEGYCKIHSQLDTENREELSNINEFLESCKGFKQKLEKYEQATKPMPSEKEVKKLVKQINQTLELCKQAKTEGLVSDSVDCFIKSCENAKNYLLSGQGIKSEQSKVFKGLNNNVESIIKLISEIDDEHSDVLQCDTENDSFDDNILVPTICTRNGKFSENFQIEDLPDCKCGSNMPQADSVCTVCKDQDQDDSYTIDSMCDLCPTQSVTPDESIVYPCKGCTDNSNSNTQNVTPDKSIVYPCKACSDNSKSNDVCMEDNETSTTEYPPYESPPNEIDEAEVNCHICKQHLEQNKPENSSKDEEDSQNTENVEQNTDPIQLGYFEKKVKKVVVTTRKRNKDGAIDETTETTVFTSENKIDDENKFYEDDEDYEGDEGKP